MLKWGEGALGEGQGALDEGEGTLGEGQRLRWELSGWR